MEQTADSDRKGARIVYYIELGDRSAPTVIMLHGAFFVDAFGRQYPLSNQYHLVIPHIKGFGKAAKETFETGPALEELRELVSQYDEPVYLIGFSVGAQLAFKLVSENPELFRKAILVSPFLMKKDEISDRVTEENLKMLRSMKNRVFCRAIALMNGLPKQSRADFVESMQLVSEESVKNCVDNGISFDTVDSFSACNVPILALAGEKEQAEIKDSVKRMAELNPRCRYEIWDKAKHNIPPVFAKRLNETILSFFYADRE